MEEFSKIAEDTVVEQAETVIAREVQAQNVEPEIENEEGRKRKRVEKEERAVMKKWTNSS